MSLKLADHDPQIPESAPSLNGLVAPQNSAHYSGRLRGSRISEDQFNKLQLSYRTSLTDHSAAARLAGVSYGTAKKAFENGISINGQMREPISHTLTRELQAALVEIGKLKEDGMKRTDMLAIIDRENVETQMTLVQMGRGATSNAMAALAVSAHILNGAVRLASRVSTLLEDPAYCPSPREAASLLRTIMHTGHFAMESAITAQTLEKNIRDNMKMSGTVGAMSPEEAKEIIHTSARSAARLKRADARVQGIVASTAEETFDVGKADTEGESSDEEDVDPFQGVEDEEHDFDHAPAP